MQLDELAATVRERRLKLAYSQDGATLAFEYRGLPSVVKQQIRSHRRGLALLMLQGDTRLCPCPEWHRREWYYVGSGRYACLLCQQLDCAQLGMWKAGGYGESA